MKNEQSDDKLDDAKREHWRQWAIDGMPADKIRLAEATWDAALATLSERGLCAWTPDDDGVYQTGCGEAFTFIDAGPKENGMKFCCYCGITMSERPNERNSTDG